MILAGSDKKALPMYLLGKKLQKEFGFSFELAYSDGHPDLNMAWLTPYKASRVATNVIIDNKNSSSNPQKIALKPLLSEDATDLGQTLKWSAPWISKNELAEQTAQNFSKELIKSTVNEVNNVKTISDNNFVFPPLVAPPALTEIKVSTKSSIQPKEQNRLANKDYQQKTPNSQDHNFAPYKRNKSLISSVKISPVRLKNVAIGSSRMIASNKSLNYIYVEVANNKDFDRLKSNLNTVNVLRNKNERLLAQIGVYSNTNIGVRLKNLKLQELRAQGFVTVTYNAEIA